MQPTRDRTALIVVDMQNGFCAERGSINGIGLPAARLQPAVLPCRQLMTAARAVSIPIVYTRYVFRVDHSDAGIMGTELIPDLKNGKTLMAGTWDIEVVDELKPLPTDIVIDKNRPSAFFGTDLEKLLRGRRIENLVVCGVTTNCCVESTVRDAGQRDFRNFVVRDAVAEYEDDRHEVALKSMGMLFGHLTTVDEVLNAWSDGRESFR